MANTLDTMKAAIVTALEADVTLAVDAAKFRGVGEKRNLKGDLVAYCWFGAGEPEFNSETKLTRDWELYIELVARDTVRINDAIERLDVMVKDLTTGGFFRTLYDSHSVIMTKPGRVVAAYEDETGNLANGLYSCTLRVRYDTTPT